jgi:regulator of sigma D
MIDVSTLIIDIFDTLMDSKLPESELSDVMTQILLSMESNGVIDSNTPELSECENVHPKLTEAIENLLDTSDYDDDAYIDEDEDD